MNWINFQNDVHCPKHFDSVIQSIFASVSVNNSIACREYEQNVEINKH